MKVSLSSGTILLTRRNSDRRLPSLLLYFHSLTTSPQSPSSPYRPSPRPSTPGHPHRPPRPHWLKSEGRRHYVGLGHVYQGRYKSFPVEEDEHFLAVARYVERNAPGPTGSARGRIGGRVSGGVVVELRRTRRSWPRGRWRFRKTGWSESIAPTTRASWRATPQRPARVAVWRDGMAETDPSVSAWNRRTARRSAGHRAAGRGGQRLVSPMSAYLYCQYRTCPVFRSFALEQRHAGRGVGGIAPARPHWSPARRRDIHWTARRNGWPCPQASETWTETEGLPYKCISPGIPDPV